MSGHIRGSSDDRGGRPVRTVLVCVRTPVAAQTIAVCADRLGVSPAVRTAVTGVEVMARLAERPADLVLVDTALTRPDPVAFVRRVLGYAPGATVVLFGPEDSQVAQAAVRAGARGLIRGGDQDLVTTVTKTLLLLNLAPAGTSARPPAGPIPAPAFPPDEPLDGPPQRPSSPEAVAEPPPAPSPRGRVPLTPRRPALTKRELQVLRGMAEGKSNAEIGRDLFVSEDTVKTHARRLFRKLNARDRAHAVAAGFRAGLVA
jgi:DNA-binding NarL/FixJ family response regulator